MPPLGSFAPKQGFVPDFPVLTMFDEFTIDGQAYEKIRKAPSNAWLGSWPEVIRMLDAEGVLSTVDIENEVKQVASARGEMLRRDMRDPAKWADAMTYFDTLVSSANRALGSKPTLAEKLAWDFEPDMIPGVEGSDGQSHILSRAPLVDPGDDPNDAHYQLHELALGHLRRQLRDVNAGLAVAAHLNIAPMFWAPYKGYLEAKSECIDTAKDANDRTEAARLFFRLAFPRYKPETVREFSRLRQDKRLRKLRDVITTAAKTGDVMDPDYPQRIFEQVLKVEKKVGHARQIVGWISTIVGSLPLPGVGLATAAASEVISVGIEKFIRKDWNWFYLISDGTGHS